MTYEYIELVVKTTTAKSNINAAINILKELNLNPAKMRKMKLDYLQTIVFFLNQEGEKIGFIQGNVNDEKPALLTLYC